MVMYHQSDLTRALKPALKGSAISGASIPERDDWASKKLLIRVNNVPESIVRTKAMKGDAYA